MQILIEARPTGLNKTFEQRHTADARRALDLVGRTVVPAAGSERTARANGKPALGVVTGVYFPDLEHSYVIVAFASDDTSLMYAHDLDALPEAPDATQVNYAR